MLIGLFLLTLVARSHIPELGLTWRLLLIGMGLGLFSGPNQALLMSVGERETMGAASALSNLGTRIGSVCGPLVLGLTWTSLAGFSAQVGVGMLIIVGFASLNLLFAWLSIQRRSRSASPEEEPGSASEGRTHAEAL